MRSHVKNDHSFCNGRSFSKEIRKYKNSDLGRCLAPSAIGSIRSAPHCGGDSLLGGACALFADRRALCAFLIMTLDVFRMYVKIEKVEKTETNVLVVKGE